MRPNSAGRALPCPHLQVRVLQSAALSRLWGVCAFQVRGKDPQWTKSIPGLLKRVTAIQKEAEKTNL